MSFGLPHSQVSPSFRELVARGAALLDVRSAEEFSAAHLEGAINIPLHELEARLSELGPKQRPVVIYCRSGRRSSEAARVLWAAGFTRVHDLGAMFNWPKS